MSSIQESQGKSHKSAAALRAGEERLREAEEEARKYAAALQKCEEEVAGERQLRHLWKTPTCCCGAWVVEHSR